MKEKMHKALIGLKQVLFAALLILFSGKAHSQATYTVNYTGGMQTMTLAPGNWQIECWGANGGSITTLSGGGMGGYSKGNLNLLVQTTITIFVGGKGNPATGTSSSAGAGGWNGGGGGSAVGRSGGGGGGATDVRLGGIAATDRIIVAGGGGGAAYYGSSLVSTSVAPGGNGGGLSGLNGSIISNTGLITTGGGAAGANGATPGPAAVGTSSGTATGGGGGGISSGASVGQPGIGGGAGGAAGPSSSGSTGSAGGGGGGYAGGAGGVQTGNAGVAGGGGSGYVGGVINGSTTAFGQAGFSANPILNGNGLVIITELCNIALTASGNYSLSPVICAGQSLTLTTDAISNYVWSTGASTSSVVVSPTTSTVYTLTATSPANCTASRSISVTVSGGQPTLSVVSSTNQTCVGKTATLTATGAVNYTWTNGVVNGVSFFPNATQTYTVVGDNGCGTVQAVSTITVSPLAVSIVGSNSVVCTNKTATLSVTASANSYTWNPGNSVITNPNYIVNPQSNTVYTVTATDGTCIGTASFSLTANPVPTITSSSSASLICPGGTVSLTATGGINYTWTPVNLNASSITASPNISTLYTVQGDNSFGCYNSSSQVVVVGTQPTLVVSTGNSTICDGGSATLTATGANSYLWTGGPATNTYIVNPSQNTTFTVVGTNSTSGCTDTKFISISVFSPSLTITANSIICNGASSNLSASGGVSYTWSPGGLPFQSISVSPASSSVYTVTGVANQGALNCPVSATVQITVNPTPTLSAVASPTSICPKQTATITANGASTYTWVGTNTTVVNTSVNVGAAAASVMLYTLSGTNPQGCESSITVPFNVSACTFIFEEGLQTAHLSVYPNPNNGVFTVAGEGEMILKLINELGQNIKTIKLAGINDYKVSVDEIPNGIYFIVGENVSRKIVVSK